jgi:FAD/FMN-containing dehydrogenase
MKISGWGRYPWVNASIASPPDPAACQKLLQGNSEWIARGLGRSYGDSSLSGQVISTGRMEYFKSFDSLAGELVCDSGVSLLEILNTFVPQGWFLPVSPGTRYVTVGGAIAADVHGKNHHIDGSFCDHVRWIELLLGNGEQLIVSREAHPELFFATCGGMGLTGVILSACFTLKPIESSEIIESIIKAPNLDSVLDGLEQNVQSTYSVAWIDCLAKGKDLGRSLLMLGEHAKTGPLCVSDKKTLGIPMDAPDLLLNPLSIRLFNELYYAKASAVNRERQIGFETYFYPLDQIRDWNRLYGKSGFLQYQFVIPLSAGREGLRAILDCISSSGKGSFLAVLKTFGKGNQNDLSFPIEGYSLALDFKVDNKIFPLLSQLDAMVLDLGGRLYLAKDARMSELTFKKSYPKWENFQEVRSNYHARGKFSSIQSKRLGLD